VSVSVREWVCGWVGEWVPILSGVALQHVLYLT